MMGVVEEHFASCSGRAFADPLDPLRLVPFVHDDDIRAIEHPLQIERSRVVANAFQFRKGGMKVRHRSCALLFEKMHQAPGVRRLIDIDLVATMQQFADDAAQEMRVTVIPIRNQGVIEEYEFHATARSPPMRLAANVW
jgi:hypothetical protein